jgi:predicted dinucleotide-binding enzyme
MTKFNRSTVEVFADDIGVDDSIDLTTQEAWQAAKPKAKVTVTVSKPKPKAKTAASSQKLPATRSINQADLRAFRAECVALEVAVEHHAKALADITSRLDQGAVVESGWLKLLVEPATAHKPPRPFVLG